MAKYLIMFTLFIFEGETVLQYMNCVFPIRRSRGYLLATFSITYFVMFLAYWLDMVPVNLLLFTGLNFLLALVNYDVGMKPAFFHSAMITAFMFLSELVLVLIVQAIFGENAAKSNRMDLYVVTIVLCKLLFFILCKAAGKVAARESRHEKSVNKNYFLLAALPLSTFVLLSSVYFMVVNSPVEIGNSLALACGVILLLFANGIVYGVYEGVVKTSRQITALQLATSQQDRDHKFYEILQKQYQEIRCLSHDIRNHLASISMLLEQKQVEKALGYIHDISDDYNLYGEICISGNKMLDVICSRYREECKSKNIDFSVNNEGLSLDFIGDVDLCTILTNVLDNAMEACEKEEEGKRKIHLSIFTQNEVLNVINLVNSCTTPPVEINHSFVTSKNDKFSHGIGLLSVRRTAEKYGGIGDFYYEEADHTFHASLVFTAPKTMK